MKVLIFSLMAMIGGVFLAVQAGFNSQLGLLLKQPVLAVVSASIASAVFGSLFILIFGRESLQIASIKQVPLYLWFIGGLFSMAGISLYFYTIPKLGISRMVALGLCGQLLFSLVAETFGLFDLLPEPVTTTKIIGILTLITGIILINIK